MPMLTRVSAGSAAVLLAAALGGCAMSPAPGSPGAAASLNETRSTGPSRWELVRWQQPDGSLKTIPHGDNGEPIIFEFNDGIDAAQGTVKGHSGCNRFSGSYSKTDAGMRFGRIAGTRMACPPPRMEVETALLKAMEQPFTTVGTQPSAGSGGRQIVWKTAGGDLLQFAEREGVGRRGDKMDAQQAGGVEKTVYVDSQRVDCTGVAKQTCYRVRDNPSAPWQLWYGPIEGLDFEPGVAYTLRVREYRVPNPPADASAIRWELLKVEARTRAN
ncbi:DUF4377 domain-containing protein [Cupriavidus respiraculi]|uniref:DUF4377 domain-containing protein n=1 Tax=Cupriavidus respiraculi TaxID=195930 RepID=A0ABM8XCM3_9BURK|nr:META and DUF4377 domain-containing protein [Cupriavidus respiraculi]MBY4949055.1 META and DUF4377 domain-containing protein [Cupriavidus respiraculi]CAG9177834.1 hypothetical protein LMG21510_03408 [Cupriavidus respiraculi]